jgi:hypothetical protein
MVDQVILGKVARKSEMQHAAGEFGLTLPNMAEYGEGKAGVLLVADIGGHWETGRGWRLDKLGDIDRLAASRSAGDLEPGLMAYVRDQMGGDLVDALLSNEPFEKPARKPSRPIAQPTQARSAAMFDINESADRAAASREKAKAALAAVPPVDTTLSPGQRRQVAAERRRQRPRWTRRFGR